ncbi:uncharacterized protein HD556DRAFT_1442244 [Suillus plorans]|uniref:DUF6532 domain-containing protein n=1 Tax=Suillus plorans TaxID=116603 RepID=A0A9P7ASI4_9AGAM|nr:uncharacterized protein HD556DRAFT_1442244 [Suillus plorans]KAG1795402.1 hypothetical protein HD556DRAFT_1442244 [Suillus plorans]
MPDVLIMNHRPLDPPSPTSSATYIECSSPGYKAPMINKGTFNFEPLYGSRSPTSMSSRLSTGVNHDIPPGNFLAEAQTILSDSNIPMDVIKEAISAQFATCEKHRNLLMSKMWELEEITRWKRFSKRTVATLQKEHSIAQSGLKLWLDLAQKQISRDSADTIQTYRREQEALTAVQMDLVNLEGLASSQGMADGDLIQEGTDDDDDDEYSAMSDNDSIKPGCKSDLNPSLQPDSTQLGLQEEHTQPPLLYSDFSVMMEGYDDNEGEEEEEEEARNDQRGSYREHQPLPYNNLPQPHYGRNHSMQDQDPGAPQHYQPLPYYPQPDHDPGVPQHYQPLPYYPPPQLQYDDLPPSSPPRDPRFDNQLSMPSSSRQPAPPPHHQTRTTIYQMYLRLKISYLPESRNSSTLHAQGSEVLIKCEENASSTNRLGVQPKEPTRATHYNWRHQVSVTVPIPSRQQLPAPITPSSLQPNADPGPRQLTDKELKDVKKEAKRVMRRKVLLKNAMPTTERNTGMAKEAFLEVVGRVVSGVSLTASQIPDRTETCKKLSGITTTVRGVFKKEAQRLILNHYSLSLEAGDTRSLTDHRETTVAPLLVNHSYLFKDPTVMSPVNHPAVIETICNSLWTTHLHEALDFNELDKLYDLFSIRGAAVHNTLLEFQDGVYKSVQFSPVSLSATEYKAIQTHNSIVHDTPTLHSASLSVKQNMIALGTALRAR